MNFSRSNSRFPEAKEPERDIWFFGFVDRKIEVQVTVKAKVKVTGKVKDHVQVAVKVNVEVSIPRRL